MYTIKRTAEMTGVSQVTLRAWDRRYGLSASSRSPSGYRLYDDDSVRRIRRMVELIQHGLAPAQAAEQVVPTRVRPGPVAAQPVTDPIGEFLDGTRRLDADAVRRALTAARAARDYEAFVDDWLFPTLTTLGSQWARGELSVASEHMTSTLVRHELITEYDALRPAPPGPRVVVGCPPGVHHDLGLLAFAVALRRCHVQTVYLGADVPAEGWRWAMALPDSSCAVLAAPERDNASLHAVVGQLLATAPPVLVCVGGAGQDTAAAGVVRLGHRVGPAAARVAELLAPSVDAR